MVGEKGVLGEVGDKGAIVIVGGKGSLVVIINKCIYSTALLDPGHPSMLQS